MKNTETKASLIGGRIKEAREEEGMSQLDLAKLLNFESATAVSLIEKGERKLTAENLDKLADFLHRPISFFLGREEGAVTVRTALRADKDIPQKDIAAIETFIEFIKNK